MSNIKKTNIIYFQEERDVSSDKVALLQKLLDLNFTAKTVSDRYRKLLDGKKVIFVGQLYLSNDEEEYILFCYPKYLHLRTDIHELVVNEDTKDRISELQSESITAVKHEIKVLNDVIQLSEYRKENNLRTFNVYFKTKKEKTVSLASVAEYLLMDAYENGIYKFETQEESINGLGVINWGKTIEQCIPIIKDSLTIYPDTITKQYIEDTQGEIFKLYVAALNDSYRNYSVLLDISNIELPSEYVEISNYTLAVNQLKGFLSQVFDERGVFLINALCAWYELKSIYHEDFYGTTNYNKVWEEVCQKVFHNNKGLWSGNMEVVQWNLFSEKRNDIIPIIDVNARSLEPDITFLDENNNVFFILDAKYYYPTMEDDRHMSGLPATYDLVKQLVYYNQLFKMYGAKYTYINALLIPKYSESEEWLLEYMGYTNMIKENMVEEIEQDESRRFPPQKDSIQIFYVNTRKIYEEYLSNGKYFDSIKDRLVRLKEHETL